MGLNHLPAPDRHNDTYHAAIFNNTWGHYSPQKNVSYKGLIRFTLTDHSHYGSQPIIISYDFPNLEGPYIHDELFNDVCDWTNEYSGKHKRLQKFEIQEGCIYEVNITFRNYRFYYGDVKLIFPLIRK